MPNEKPDAEAALRKLGQRIRQGFAERYPVQETCIEAVKNAVREQYEQEQIAEREIKPTPNVKKEKGRQPPEPDQER